MSLIKHELDLKGGLCWFCGQWYPANELRIIEVIEHKNDRHAENVCDYCREGDKFEDA